MWGHSRVGKQKEQAAEQTDGRADLAAIGSLSGWRSIVTAKELVCTINEVYLHWHSFLRAETHRSSTAPTTQVHEASAEGNLS